MTTTTLLLPQHTALLRDSGIATNVARERGYFSATTIFDLKRFGFAEPQCRVPALGIPIYTAHGEIGLYQSRPDDPRVNQKTGKPVKYETAAKARMCLDVPPRARPFLGDPTTPLWITEGARKADSAVSNGIDCCIALLGVWNWRGTNEDGGKSALPDWESVALNGRDVFIAFDSDVTTKPAVQAALRRLKAFLESRGAAVRLVFLPAGPGGAKVGLDDFFVNGGTADALRALATDTLLEPDDTTPPPVPLEIFPPAVRRYLADSAEALGVAPDLIAVPFLAMVGGAVGNSRALLVKPGWVERAIIWAAVIAPPGVGKTPGLAVAQHPLDVLQRAAWNDYQCRLTDWERAAAAAKAAKQDEPPRPTLEHFMTVDSTAEALARILAHSAGVTMIRDELCGWSKSHDAYRKAGDRELFLSLWAGQPLKVDRRSAEPLFVPRPALCVTGGIQPDRLPELRGDAETLDGFIDRFIFSYPDTRPQLWTEATPDLSDRAAVERLFARLRVPGDSETVLHLSSEARQVFAAWFNENARHVAASRGLAAGFAAKLPGQLARLVLILHSLNRPDDLTGTVPVETVEDGIALVEYFAAHLERVLPVFGSVALPRAAGLRGRIVRILERAGGDWIDRTTISQGLGNRTPADQITATLDALAAEGLAESRTVPTGARPREEWRTTLRRYEEMKKSPAADGNTSYLHKSDSNDPEVEEWEL